ncbi:MAG: hypothetical protein IT457_04055 [Planctomycetes bacterium]|nr:hypothetical protein [Planctomycetota bacterium]
MSQQNDDFISFEKALRDLKMQSEELRKLVSEGEIRAFRDGDSMKFRREDLESLRKNRGASNELVFDEALEDDTGMVTEEISAEDTLLADDEDEKPAPRAAAAASSAPRGTRARVNTPEEKAGEPAWVLAASIVGAILMLLGLAQAYWINAELPPSGITSMWAK